MQKLKQFYKLKNRCDKCDIKHDSVYARILLKIGLYEFNVNKNYIDAIKYTTAAIRININGKKAGSKYFTAQGYFNIAYYYDELGAYTRALNFYDSTIYIAQTFPDTASFTLDSKLGKVLIFFHTGDYEKAIEESISGMVYSLKKKDSSYFLAFLNQKAQSLYFKNNFIESLLDINIIIKASKRQKELFQLASALKIKAMILEATGKLPIADSLINEAIKTRIKTNDYHQIALDYNDYGTFYIGSLPNYKKAINNFKRAIAYAGKIKDSVVIARADNNIEAIYLKEKNYKACSQYCIKSLKYLGLPVSYNIYLNPNSDQLNALEAKDLVLGIMNHKVKILLALFLYKKDKNALNACLQTSLITDTLISKMRNAQSGTESKLFWRDNTRQFYENAIEACYLNNNSTLAFYFMEKSRAVLLNDKLNELNASSYLSAADAAKQDNYQIKIVEHEQKLSVLNESSKQYQIVQLQLIDVRNDFEHFIKSLEQSYPAYYQYKYADDVSTLQQFQSYLKKKNQSFVHYFLGDTLTYILAITPMSTKILRLSQKDFNKEQLSKFLQLCADKEMLMSHYNVFAALSNSIYKTIFQPLQLPAGRTIICADNIVIPFDALCTDKTGKNFLLNNYSFSYVYSARSLIKSFQNKANATGNFIGFAPVSFSSYLNVQDLKNAAGALQASSSYYNTNKLFTYQNATRSNFFKHACSYSIVNIFSHAHADTTDNEPVLYMHDSLIHLSELQLLNNPATKLVLLSACQTNVGRNATGEGIYSLARGFAAAGIPSVSATLWKADEQTIYAVSEKFNQYLSEGTNKDEALQKAKLYFINNNINNEKLLPYYWANMILIGNADAIKFSKAGGSNFWWWLALCIALFLFVIIIWQKKFLKKRS